MYRSRKTKQPKIPRSIQDVTEAMESDIGEYSENYQATVNVGDAFALIFFTSRMRLLLQSAENINADATFYGNYFTNLFRNV